MASRPKFGDLVIIVPGILGSRLVHNGVPLWGDSRTFLQWVRAHGADLAHLAVGGDDPSLEDLGDGIAPDGLIDGFLVVGRFVKIGGYASLTRALQKSFALKLGENLQLFAYDWRRDLRVATRRLAIKAEGWLEAWRSRSGNRGAKIVLIGHAMGGLVARGFADVEAGWPSIRKIISIGTPFLGSIRALDAAAEVFRKTYMGLSSRPEANSNLPFYAAATCIKLAKYEISRRPGDWRQPIIEGMLDEGLHILDHGK